METELETYIDTTRNVASTAVLKKLFLSAVAEEGFENAVFARTNHGRLVSLPWAEFPTGYVETYRTEEWDKIDPVVQRAASARTPFKWSDAGPRGGFTKDQKRFFEDCRDMGVHSGITIPIHGTGREIDLVSLSIRSGTNVPAPRMARLYMLSVQYWMRYCELVDGRDQQASPLTNKEIECLRWCKEGKTNWEIGEILNISEKTVEFHLSNGMRKLGANNRISAVVMGIKMGILQL